MILINVLLIVALASGVLALLVIQQDSGLQRATRIREAATADAAVRGGELSAIVALRRDLAAGATSDNPTEPWAKLADRAARIEGGTFSLAIADAQAKFNVNALARDDVLARAVIGQIVAALRLPPDTGLRIEVLLHAIGGISSLDQIAVAGIDPATIARLATLATALPAATTVNANTADERLLAILTANPVAARQLVSIRSRQGYLQSSDFIQARVPVPGEVGFTSNFFWVRTRVTIGETSREQTSLLARRGIGAGAVAAISRWNGLSAPAEAPPSP